MYRTECLLWIVSEHTLVCVLLLKPGYFSLMHCYYWWIQENKGEEHSSMLALVLLQANGITSAQAATDGASPKSNSTDSCAR